jgi:flagellar biosynthesis GTPase FlhF
VVEWLRAQHGEVPPGSLAEELRLAREAMIALWPRLESTSTKPEFQVHIFVGPPGVGKTTCLCKLLTQKVLFDGGKAQIWRLDGHVANVAESLSVYGEILGVPVERTRPAELRWEAGESLFIDLPGVAAHDTKVLGDLKSRLNELPAAEVHLVLNAAYEVNTLLAQIRAYANLGISDLVLTHLDEEARWGKLWNLALGTNFSIRWLSSGQNIPGDFGPADPATFVSHVFR